MQVPSVIRKSSIYILGEAPGENEAREGVPFIGWSGQELRNLCAAVGINMDQVSYGNVFRDRPPDNNLALWSIDKALYLQKLHTAGRIIPPPQIGLYLDPDRFLPEFDRIGQEIDFVQPNVIIALGGTALWAVTHRTGIKKHRGAITTAVGMGRPKQKVLPTYHPAAILRDHTIRVIVLADLQKAAYEAQFPEIRVLRRAIYIPESYADFTTICKLLKPNFDSPEPMAVDTETYKGQIDTVGFGFTKQVAFTIPIFSRFTYQSIFSEWEEKQVWHFIRDVLVGPKPKIFQNGLYDISYFLFYNIRVQNWTEDTMLLHHALYSQLPKGLDFLGSCYANEIAWKNLRPKGAGEELKRNQ